MKAESIDFSVIIPVYNGSEYIARAVSSALCQQGISLEVIVVDDGSTDQSAEIAASVHPSINVIKCVNAGPSAARNRGILEARGDFIAFLDVDDQWTQGKLAKQAELFNSDASIGLVFGDYSEVDLQGKASGWQGGHIARIQSLGLHLVPLTDDGFRINGSVEIALIKNTSFMHMSTVTVRREVFDMVGLFDVSMTHAEDLDLWIRIAKEYRIGLTQVSTAIVEQRPTSLSRQYITMDEHLISLYMKLYSNSAKYPKEVVSCICRFIEQRHLSLGWQYRTDGATGKARHHYLSALRFKLRLRTVIALMRTYVRL